MRRSHDPLARWPIDREGGDMSDAAKDVEAITELERRRFDAIVAGDFEDFAAVCHPELIYTHSTGGTDSLESYLARCRAGFYDYQWVDHPVTKIVVSADVVLVLGEMNADITAGGVPKQLRNSSLAVWVRDGETWKLIAFQATPRV
jgi:ketosteroid isomerase-like protein